MYTETLVELIARRPGRRGFGYWLALGLPCVVLLEALASAQTAIDVTDAEGLREAVSNARAGDVITLAPGDYEVFSTLATEGAGSAGAPIVVRAEALGQARIRCDAVECFRVTQPNWHFENLDIEGVCASHDDCEHAFHIVGRADGAVVSGCVLHEYNAPIKGNGEPVGPNGSYVWADDVVIEHTELFNRTPRQTSNPVTLIDVVGGRRWVVRDNFIHDHAKAGDDTISYAAFFKGNSHDGTFERNLVMCEWLHTGFIRLGLSFGGGGTGPDSICEDSSCTPEHQGGLMRNNVILGCSEDVGIYLNAARDTRIDHNLLFGNAGIDVRFADSTADIRNNILTGAIRDRDGGAHTEGSNLLLGVDSMMALYRDPGAGDLTLRDGVPLVDQGEAGGGATDDFCGRLRTDGRPDIGPIEYGEPGVCQPSAWPTVLGLDDDGVEGSRSGSGDIGADVGDAGDRPEAGPGPTPDEENPPTAASNGTGQGCACGLVEVPRAPSALAVLTVLGLLGVQRDRRRR